MKTTPSHTIPDWDLIAGAFFALLGLLVALDAWSFPGATRSVPGPAFVPIAIGLLLITLSAALVLTTRSSPHPDYWARASDHPVLPRIAIVILLLVVYVSLWDVVPFVVRTPILLITLYRRLGESWTRTILLAVLLTAALSIVFEGVLSVQL